MVEGMYVEVVGRWTGERLRYIAVNWTDKFGRLVQPQPPMPPDLMEYVVRVAEEEARDTKAPTHSSRLFHYRQFVSNELIADLTGRGG